MLSAIIFTDVMATWLSGAELAISRCTRSPSFFRNSRTLLRSAMRPSISVTDDPDTRSSSELMLVTACSLAPSGTARRRCATSRRMNSRISPSNSLGLESSSALAAREGTALMCVPVNRECCYKAWVSTSTAVECAMRIGPLKAEVAAKRGREKTDLDEIDLCWAGTALLLTAQWAHFSHRRKNVGGTLWGNRRHSHQTPAPAMTHAC